MSPSCASDRSPLLLRDRARCTWGVYGPPGTPWENTSAFSYLVGSRTGYCRPPSYYLPFDRGVSVFFRWHALLAPEQLLPPATAAACAHSCQS